MQAPSAPFASTSVQQKNVYDTAHVPLNFAGDSIRVNVGPDSSRVVCPSCYSSVSTRIERNTSSKTHLMALVMCFLGLCLCMFLPYCMDSCKNTDHYCPSCNSYLGTYKNN